MREYFKMIGLLFGSENTQESKNHGKSGKFLSKSWKKEDADFLGWWREFWGQEEEGCHLSDENAKKVSASEAIHRF